VNTRLVASFLGVTALWMALVALGNGALASFLTAPIAVGLGALALALRREVARTIPRWVVGTGLLAVLAGLALAAAGSVGGGLATAALGVGVVFTGSQLSLELDPPPSEESLPSTLSAGLNAGIALDEMVRLLTKLDEWVRPPRPLVEVAQDVRAAAERHLEQGWVREPWLAHFTPPALEKPNLTRTRIRGAGQLEHLRFESEYEPNDPEIRGEYLAQHRNRIAHAYLWRHPSGPRPTLICIHGYRMGRISLDARAWDLDWLHRHLGLDVAAVVLPLHGPRSIGRRSGSGFLDTHPLWTNAAFGQAIWELRRLAGWLRGEGAPLLGVYGMSLGGYTAALFASIESRLSCAITMIPVVSLAGLIQRDLSEEKRLAGEALGVTEAVLEQAWAPHAPLCHTPKVAKAGRLIVAGLADRICPPDQAQALFEHWERPAIHWFPGTHLLPIGRRATRARMEQHLRDTLLAEPVPDPLPLTRFRQSPEESPPGRGA
jgi:hypothetical protein